jgi:hypothetical protein
MCAMPFLNMVNSSKKHEDQDPKDSLSTHENFGILDELKIRWLSFKYYYIIKEANESKEKNEKQL